MRLLPLPQEAAFQSRSSHGPVTVKFRPIRATEALENLRLESDAHYYPIKQLEFRGTAYAEEPVFDNLPEAVILIAGQLGYLSCNASGTPEVQYHWTKNGSPFQSNNNGMNDFYPAKAADVGLYQVRASNALAEIVSPTPSCTSIVRPFPIRFFNLSLSLPPTPPRFPPTITRSGSRA